MLIANTHSISGRTTKRENETNGPNEKWRMKPLRVVRSGPSRSYPSDSFSRFFVELLPI
jgi:hypothetical protein